MIMTCNICGEQVTPDDVMRHLSDHGVPVDVETWPDGEPVVVDHTLKPEDFTS